MTCLFKFQQRIEIPRRNYITALYADLGYFIMHRLQNNFLELRKQKAMPLTAIKNWQKKHAIWR